jgi:hypothetical protein
VENSNGRHVACKRCSNNPLKDRRNGMRGLHPGSSILVKAHSEQDFNFFDQDTTHNRSPDHDKTRNDCRKARIEWERRTEMEAVLAAERRAAEEEVRFPTRATAGSFSTGSLDSLFCGPGKSTFWKSQDEDTGTWGIPLLRRLDES